MTLADGTTIEEPSRKVKTGDRFVVDIPEPEPAMPLPQALDLRHPLRGCRPAGARQAGRAGRPSGAGQPRRHAGQRPAGPLRRQPVGHRRRRAGRASSTASTRTPRASWSWPRTTAPIRRCPSSSPPTTSTASTRRWSGARRSPSPARSRRPSAAIPSTASGWPVRKTSGRAAVTEYWRREALRSGPVADRQPGRLPKLETGRTHQVRVHLAHIGHPVVGDPVYGRKPERRGARKR